MTTQSFPLSRTRFAHTLFIVLAGGAITGLALADVALPQVAAGIGAALMGTFVVAALAAARRPPHFITGLLALALYPALVPLALVAETSAPGAAPCFGGTLILASLIGSMVAPVRSTADDGRPYAGLQTYRLLNPPRAAPAMAAGALSVVAVVAFFRTDDITALGLVAGGAAALVIALWVRAGTGSHDMFRPEGFVTALGVLWSAPPVALFSAMTGRYVLVPTRNPAAPSEG